MADVIGHCGVPKSLWTQRLFARHGLAWKSPSKFEFVPVDVLGCWDTVAAYGMSKSILSIPFRKTN